MPPEKAQPKKQRKAPAKAAAWGGIRAGAGRPVGTTGRPSLGSGRKKRPAEKNKSLILNMRLSIDENKKIEKLIERSNLKKSDLIRNLINKEYDLIFS